MADFEQTSYNVDTALEATDKYFAGESIENTNSVLYDQTINSCIFYLSKSGSPTGQVSACVYDRSTNSKKHTFGTMLASDLTTSAQAKTFTGSGYTLTANDVIGIEHNADTWANRVNFHYQNTDVFDSNESIFRRFDGSTWTEQDSADAAFQFTKGQAGGTASLFPPPVAWI